MNSFDPIDPALVDVHLWQGVNHDGYPDDLAAEDTPDALRMAAGETSREFPQALWIEPKDWADKARDNDKYHTWPMNYSDRYTNQNPTHECTTHSLTKSFEIARNRQRGVSFSEGPKAGVRYDESKLYGSVWASVMSIYAEANPGQWGGANIRQVMEILVRRGFLPDKIQPAEYNFKHVLQGTAGKGGINQSSGPWTRVSGFPEGWQETAKHFRALEIIFPDSWEQAVCLVLHGYAVGVGRNGHAVPWCQAIFEGNNFSKMAYPDSYDVTRYDSASLVRSAWRGSYAVATVTAPDDWSKPAG